MFATIITILHALYKIGLSPFIGQSCRYQPSCSDYMAISLKRFGLIKGFALGIKRILRCRPGGGLGYDPVPEREDEIQNKICSKKG